MSGDKERERQFTENIDRLLHHQEPDKTGCADEENGEMLSFAQKILDLRPEPAPGFQNRLKQQLLVQLREQQHEQQEQHSGWLKRLVAGHPLRQAMAGVAVVAVALVVVFLGTDLFEPDSSTTMVTSTPTTTSSTTSATTTSSAVQETATATSEPSTVTVETENASASAGIVKEGESLLIHGTTDREEYQPGETVQLEIAISNISNEPFTIEQYPPIISIMEYETGMPVRTILPDTIKLVLPPGDETFYIVKWDQRDDSGQLIASGQYYLEMENLNARTKSLYVEFAEPVLITVAGE